MKKFISMFAFAAMIVLGAFAFASCGSDDEDDPTPTPEATNKYRFKVEVKDFESAKALYPDLAMTYTIPGMEPKTVALTAAPINIEQTSAKAGKVAITFKGKLDASKVDPAKKYSLDIDIVYEIKAGNYRTSTENPNFTRTGQQIIESYSDLSKVEDFSIEL